MVGIVNKTTTNYELKDREIMVAVRDGKKRLACKYDAETETIEALYKGYKTSTRLEVGNSFALERDTTVTVVTRDTVTTFLIEQHFVRKLIIHHSVSYGSSFKGCKMV